MNGRPDFPVDRTRPDTNPQALTPPVQCTLACGLYGTFSLSPFTVSVWYVACLRYRKLSRLTFISFGSFGFYTNYRSFNRVGDVVIANSSCETLNCFSKLKMLMEFCYEQVSDLDLIWQIAVTLLNFVFKLQWICCVCPREINSCWKPWYILKWIKCL